MRVSDLTRKEDRLRMKLVEKLFEDKSNARNIEEKKKAEDALELYSKTFKQCNSFDEMCSTLGFETIESLEEYVLNGRTYEEYFEDYYCY